MKKKLVILLAVLSLLGTSITGCGESSKSEEPVVKEESTVTENKEESEAPKEEVAPEPAPVEEAPKKEVAPEPAPVEEAPKEEVAPEPVPVEETSKEEVPTNGIRPEFKQAMDSYESFMNEYYEFMLKYKESNGTDLGLLTDYAKYMSKYAQVVEDFEEWDDDNLSTEELSYYLDVQNRINKKLLEVAE